MKGFFSISLLVLFVIITGCKNEQKSNEINTQEPATLNEEAETSVPQEEITYASAPIMPRFPGCEDKEMNTMEKYLCANNRLSNYIHNRLRYPKIALNNKVEGTVTAQFVVRPDGLIDDIAIYNDIGYGCGETVMTIIESMNHMGERWIPGRKGGEAVRVRLAVPIEFRLRDYQKE